ncbi:hypothetical protein H2201_008803, partial [Coniosporium apollinis]
MCLDENPLTIEDDKADPNLNIEIDAAGDRTESFESGAEAPESEDELPPLENFIIRYPTVVARSNGDEPEIPTEGPEVATTLQPERRLQPCVEPSPEHDALEGRETRDLADPTTVDHPDPIEENVNDDPAGGVQSRTIREERLQSVTARDLNEPDDSPFELQDFVNPSLGNYTSSPPAELRPPPPSVHDRLSLELDFGFSDIGGNGNDNIGEDDGQAESTVLRDKSSPPRPGFYRGSELPTDNGENGSRSPNVNNLGDGHAKDDDVGIDEDRGGNRPDAHCPALVAAAQPSCFDHLSPKHQDRAADLADDVTTQPNDKDEQAKLSSSAPASLPTTGAATRSTRKRGYSKSALVEAEAEASLTPPKPRRRGRPRTRGTLASRPSAPLPSSLPALAAPAQIELDEFNEAAAEAQPAITDIKLHELSGDMKGVGFVAACIQDDRPLPPLSPAQLSTLLKDFIGGAITFFDLTTRQLTPYLTFLTCFIVQRRGVEHYAGDDDGNSEGDARPSQSAKHRLWSEEEEKCLLAWRQDGKEWDWIAGKLRRSVGAVYLRWYTKLRSGA